MLRRVGKEPEFRDGLRVTDAETLEIVRMVLVGKINRDLVATINSQAGDEPVAVGVSGEDAGLLTVEPVDSIFGFVGNVTHVRAELVHRLLDDALVPVVSTVGADTDGQPYNILVPRLTSAELRQRIGSGSVSKGMIPKLKACADAVDQGVNFAHIIDGRVEHSLLIELLTDHGVGTMIRKERSW
jgi:acetylglutamate kinase